MVKGNIVRTIVLSDNMNCGTPVCVCVCVCVCVWWGLWFTLFPAAETAQALTCIEVQAVFIE